MFQIYHKMNHCVQINFHSLHNLSIIDMTTKDDLNKAVLEAAKVYAEAWRDIGDKHDYAVQEAHDNFMAAAWAAFCE